MISTIQAAFCQWLTQFNSGLQEMSLSVTLDLSLCLNMRDCNTTRFVTVWSREEMLHDLVMRDKKNAALG